MSLELGRNIAQGFNGVIDPVDYGDGVGVAALFLHGHVHRSLAVDADHVILQRGSVDCFPHVGQENRFIPLCF